MMSLIGFPIISHQTSLNFRKSMNIQLQQNKFVPNPLIPEWSFEASEEEAKESKCILIIPNPIYSVRHGPFLLVIQKNLDAAILTPSGGVFFIGALQCLEKDNFIGAVLNIVLLRVPSDPLMGGTFYVIDVLSYCSEPLKGSVEERISIAQTMSSMFTFPSRYKFSVCSKITFQQVKKINEFATPIYLKHD
jgi:hypothetical protein